MVKISYKHLNEKNSLKWFNDYIFEDSLKKEEVIAERKNVFIISNSVTKGLAKRGISKDNNVKIRTQPACTTEAIEDQLKPIKRKKPDVIIISSGYNDIVNCKSTKKKTKKVVQPIGNASPDIQMIISDSINREDCEFSDEKSSMSNQLETYFNSIFFLCKYQ